MATKRRTAKKKDDVRSVKHGSLTYSSRPSDNKDCRIRCSPPSRAVFGDGSKQTTVRYRHRTLDIKSPASGKRKPGTRTGSKPVAKPTAKTVTKPTVKHAPKTATKKTTVGTASKTVKAPAKKPDKPTSATKSAILNKAAKEGMNAKELDKHIVVASVPKIESKPAPKAVAKAPAKTAPKTASKTASKPTQSRGVAGTFDAKQMKEIISFVDKMKGRSKKAEPMRIPIFRQSAAFIHEDRVMMLRVTSRIPGKSLVGLPVSKTRANIWVP